MLELKSVSKTWVSRLVLRCNFCRFQAQDGMGEGLLWDAEADELTSSRTASYSDLGIFRSLRVNCQDLSADELRESSFNLLQAPCFALDLICA